MIISILDFSTQSFCHVICLFVYFSETRKNLTKFIRPALINILKYTALSPRNNYGGCTIYIMFSKVWDALLNRKDFLPQYWPQFYQKMFIIGGTLNWSLISVKVTSLRLITQYLTLAFDPHTRAYSKGFQPYWVNELHLYVNLY